MRLASQLSIVAVALVLFTACSEDDPTPPRQTPTVTVSSATTTATVVRGASATYPITIVRGGGYTGAVTLSAENLPTDVSASFSPATLPNGTTASTLTLTAGQTAAVTTTPGSITIRASGTGVTAATTTVTLGVTAPTSSITLATGSTTASVTQGATSTIPLTLTRTNYTGDISLAFSGLPAGVTATLAPNSPLPNGTNATVLTLTAASTAAVTTTPATVTVTASGAAGSGVTAQTQTIAVSVTAAATPGITLTPSAGTITTTPGAAASTSVITLARQGGFTGDVGLTVTGAPAGVTATLAPTSLTGAATTSTLTVATTSAAAPGTYTLNVVGTSGSITRTQPITLMINAAPGITVALSPATLAVTSGGTATSNITVGRVGTFTGDVTLTTTGALPAGMTLVFTPANGVVTGTVASIAVNTTAATPAGTYNFTVTGTGAGNIVGTAPLTVTVTAPQAITISAAAATAAAGSATATSVVTIARTGGYTGPVTFVLSGLPAGVAGTFTPVTTGNTSTLTFTVPAGTAPNTYTGTITASGTGITNATAPITLTVTAAGGGSAVGFRFCATGFTPVFFAFRNGTAGAWTPVAVGANTTYTFTTTGNVAQVAYGVTNANGGVDMTVLYYTAAELPTIANQACIQNPATKSVTGTVAGLSATQSATVELGAGSAAVQANGPFTITNANAAVSDLFASRTSINFTTGGITVDKLILRRNVNPAAGGSIGPVLDFNSTEAVAPATAQYTVNGVAGGETLLAFNTFQSANGGSGSLFNISAANSSPLTVLGVPANLTQAGDLQGVFIFAGSNDQLNGRAVIQYNRDLANRTVTLGAALTTPTISTLATTPYARLRAAGPWQADYTDAVGVTFTQGSNRDWTIAASRGYYGAAATYELDIPDLSGVAGFNNAWGLLAGVTTNYSVNAYSGIQGLTAVAEGSLFRFGVRSGTYTP